MINIIPGDIVNVVEHFKELETKRIQKHIIPIKYRLDDYKQPEMAGGKIRSAVSLNIWFNKINAFK